MNEPQTFKHPLSGQEIRGVLMQNGDVFDGTELVDSKSGEWKPVSALLIGTSLSDARGKQFVRPVR